MVYGDDAASVDSVEQMGCPALQEVERLAKEAFEDRYGLQDFSVFDINTLLSPDLQDYSKDPKADTLAAHQVFWDMIKAKAPKVILVLTCTAGRSKHKPVKLLSSSLKLAGSIRPVRFWSNSTLCHATVVRAFHPSVYLRDDYTSDQSWSQTEVRLANQVLRLCFAMAFTSLSNEGLV